MKKLSAGLIMFRYVESSLEVFLVHPGGPYWAKKDEGAWSIPKGEYEEGEDALTVARREYSEETGFNAEGTFTPLTPLKQSSGKVVSAWAIEGDCDPSLIKSNLFSIEWPPKSGIKTDFPEVDRAGWFDTYEAKNKLVKGQVAFIDEVCKKLNYIPKETPRDQKNQQDGNDIKTKGESRQTSLF